MIIDWTYGSQYQGVGLITSHYTTTVGVAPAYYGVLKAYHPTWGWLPVKAYPIT